MPDKRRLLILNKDQFGYHTVTYKFAIGLSPHFELSYHCWDYGRSRIEAQNVAVTYVSRRGNKVARYFRFIKAAIDISRSGQFDIVFFKYFPGASVVRLFGRSKAWVFDIRTGPVSGSRIQRAFSRVLMNFESQFFQNISIISSSLSQNLGLTSRDPHILPLGSDIISSTNKEWKEFHLLYVGTLEYRNMHLTVEGLHRFIASQPQHRIRNYTIIGGGPNREEEQLKKLVDELNLAHIVTVVGRLPHDSLKPYFDTHNVGVAFVPITPYFHCQPPTKVYEYLLSGLFVLATKTEEMQKMLINSTSILSGDTTASFTNSLQELHNREVFLDSDSLRGFAVENTWEHIVNHNLLPYLNRLS